MFTSRRATITYIFWIWLSYGYNRKVCSWEYCENKVVASHCKPKGADHFQCDQDTSIPKQGTLLYHYPMTRYLRNLIIEYHNKQRDRISSGKEDNSKGTMYPKAARMREMLWDNELAYLSHLYSARCAADHTKCHSVERFETVGQNIGFIGKNNPGEASSAYELVNMTMVGYFSEKDSISDPLRLINDLKDVDLSTSGQFATVVNDRSSFLGCAISVCSKCKHRYTNDKEMAICYNFVCHYENWYIVNQPVYITADINSKAADECSDWKTKRSKTFDNLCKNTGHYFTLKESLRKAKGKPSGPGIDIVPIG